MDVPLSNPSAQQLSADAMVVSDSKSDRTATHHVLVADDEPDVESLISQKFRREIRQRIYRFTFVQNGKEAYERVLATPDIDAVLTDINMPVMDGLELVSKLQTLEHSPKVVVISAYSDMTNIRAAMNSGAFDFIVKPINFQDLVATLNKTLAAVKKEKADQRRFEQAQSQLVQSEKLSSLGQMVAGIAHEINNPVNFVYGNISPARQYIEDLLTLVDLYRNKYPDPAEDIQDYLEDLDIDFLSEDLSKLLDSMRIGADRIRTLVLSLRNFSRLDEAEQKIVDIHEGIDNTLLLLSHRLQASSDRPRIRIQKSFGSLPTISCYPSQLNQVIMNILANAVDAFDEQCESLVKSASALPQQPCISIETSQMDEQWMRIAIADNGPGMDNKTLSKLFDPFFTTKPVGKGTGLGLSISYQIITEKHRGRLSCHSVPGEGTQFIIELPIGSTR